MQVCAYHGKLSTVYHRSCGMMYDDFPLGRFPAVMVNMSAFEVSDSGESRKHVVLSTKELLPIILLCKM